MLQVLTKIADFYLYKYSLIIKKTGWLLLSGIIIGANNSSVFAQNNLILIKILSIALLNVSGISGGTVKALEIAKTNNTPTGYCDGFVNPQPNHVFRIDTFFANLKLEIESSADTTILVKGAGGIWCNDDSGSANPMIEGQWQPGVYQIWVGSYRANSNDGYKIKITGR